MSKSTSNQRKSKSRGKQPAVAPSSLGKRRLLLAAVTVAVVAVVVLWIKWPFNREINEAQHREASPPAERAPNKRNDERRQQPRPPSNPWAKIDDPSKDGWATEEFHEQAKKQLDRLAKLIASGEPAAPNSLAQIAVDEFESQPLVPISLAIVHEDRLVRVARDDGSATATAESQTFATALQHLAEYFQGAAGVRCKFKVFRVTPSENAVTTLQYFSLSGRTTEGMIEQNATWIVRWSIETTPRIESIQVEDFEQVATNHQAGPLFADCTQSVLGGNASFENQMLRGLNHWLPRIENTQDSSFFSTPGIAVGDVNGDGLDDLYVCQEQGLPNRLYVQQPDGTARDVSASSGVDWLNSSRSALLVDLDNDGDQDLVVAMLGNLVLAENDDAGQFAIKTLLPTNGDTMSTSAADYDLDGDLDLYVCGYNPDRSMDSARDRVFLSGDREFVFHDANNGGRNTLFRNDSGGGEWKFSDVTRGSGMNVNNRRWSFAASWEDIDNDGDQDLYIANDYGRDNLYRNDRVESGKVRFVEIGAAAHIENSAGGMSISWGDYNRDGHMDAYVGNMFSAAGNRVTFQPNFKTDSAEVRQRLQRFARGNTLLQNTGNADFRDRSTTAGVEMGRWAWGSLFVDVNNDGWEDIFVSNGYMTTEGAGDL